MGDLRLQRLWLRNFKGVTEFTFKPDGEDAVVFGDNATGKTTLDDAFTWLLFSKDSGGHADFNIKALDASGEAHHNLDHEVGAELAGGPNGAVTFKKVYREQWTKKRGQADRTFTGHTTDYFVDGVPSKKKEYDAEVGRLADEGAFRMLTDPSYFPERLHWQERRSVLMDVCGDVSDDDVIASAPDLADLPALLGTHTLEQFRKITLARRTEINKELDKLPIRIDEVSQGLPDAEEESEDELRAHLRTLRTARDTAQEERATIEAGGALAGMTVELREMEAALLGISNRVRSEGSAEAERLRDQARPLNATLADARAAIATGSAGAKSARADQVRIETQMKRRREDWHRANDRKFEHDGTDTCVACGQSLPEADVEAAYDKALRLFNAGKSQTLEHIDTDGAALKEQLDAAITAEALHEKNVEIFEAEEGATEGKINSLRQQIATLEDAAPDPEADPEYKAAQARKTEIEASIAELRAGNEAGLAGIDVRITDISSETEAWEQALGRIEQRAVGEARMAELAEEEQRLAVEFEKLERHLHLADEFIRVKVAMLTDRINAHFQLAQFKLFNPLIVGGLEECCEVSCPGPNGALVPYRDLNDGAKVQVGLDVIRTLQVHFDFAPPVWIDHAESVTSLPDMDCQLIRLFVSEEDKALRVEVGAEERAA